MKPTRIAQTNLRTRVASHVSDGVTRFQYQQAPIWIVGGPTEWISGRRRDTVGSARNGLIPLSLYLDLILI